MAANRETVRRRICDIPPAVEPVEDYITDVEDEIGFVANAEKGGGTIKNASAGALGTNRPLHLGTASRYYE
jgi:hypothetical protein